MEAPPLLVVVQDASLQQILLENHIPITTAASLQDADKMALDLSYAAFLLEIVSGASDEISQIKQIAATHRSMPLLIVTNASLDIPTLLALFNLRVFAILLKPVKCVKLKEIIQAAIGIGNKNDRCEIISATPAWFEVRIPAQRYYFLRVVTFLECIIMNFLENEYSRIMYALQELVHNSMEHGCGFSADKSILIRCLKTPGLLAVQIEDSGPGFDINSLPHAAIGARKDAAREVMKYRNQTGMRPGGLGIRMVYGIVDELVYNQKGNAVTMIKYLDTNKKGKIPLNEGEMEHEYHEF